MVELLDVGEPACEANVSTWSMVWDCHPLLTLTMAYDRRVFNSADNWSGRSKVSRWFAYVSRCA